MFLPIIIKLSQTVLEFWPAEDFGSIRGHKYIMKKVRIVSLACDMPSALTLPLPNIMKIFQTIKKLWSAQEFG